MTTGESLANLAGGMAALGATAIVADTLVNRNRPKVVYKTEKVVIREVPAKRSSSSSKRMPKGRKPAKKRDSERGLGAGVYQGKRRHIR